MKQYFSRKLWWQGVKKIRVAGIAMAITIIAINILFPTITAANDASRLAYYLSQGLTPTIDTLNSFSEFAPMNLALLFFAPLLAFVMFSYLNDRGKSDFYHAIPQTRLCVYLSFIAAVATWVLGVLLLSTVINLLLWQTAQLHVVVFSEVLYYLLCVALGALMLMALASLAVVLTGTLVSNLFVGVLLLAFVRVMALVIANYLPDILPVYDLDKSLFSLLYFENYLPYALALAVFGSRYHPLVESGSVAILIYSAIVTLAVLALTAYLYHIRRSETANKSAPNRYLQFVYRSAVTLPILMFCAASILWDGFDDTHLIWLTVALVVFLLYELATTKRIKATLRSIPLFFALIGVCVAIIGGMYGFKAIIAHDIPDEDRVKSISVNTNSRVDVYYPDGIAISDDEAIALVIEALEYSAPLTRNQHNQAVLDYDYKTDTYLGYSSEERARYTFQAVTIHLKGGRTMYREVWFEQEKFDRLKELYLNSAEYKKALLVLPEQRYIDSYYTQGQFTYIPQSESKTIYESFIAEYNAMPESQKIEYMENYVRSYAYHASLPILQISGSRNNIWFNENLAIVPEYFPKTFQLVMDEMCKQSTYDPLQTGLEELFSLLRGLDSSTLQQFSQYFYFELELVTTTGGGSDYYNITFNNGDYGTSEKDLAALQNVLSKVHVTDEWFEYTPGTSRELYVLMINHSSLYHLSEKKYEEDHPFYYGCSTQLYVMLTPEEAEEIITAIKYPPSQK